jgi:serine/threonine protein phosphatase 1
MKRTLVIGDIHGGLKAVHELFTIANVTGADKLIFLGDYVDGWSESAGVVEYMIALSKSNECIFIKGNHDVWCEDWLRTGEADKTWLFHGGQETVDSYAAFSPEKKLQHLYFLEAMPYYNIDEQNRLFIHAGFTSMHGPQKEFHNSNFSWDRTLWETALAMDKGIKKGSILFPKRLALFNEIYIGHTPTLFYDETVPMQGSNVWNIDTGAAFMGKLSIMDIDTKQFWQSTELFKLYPGEVGRNK